VVTAEVMLVAMLLFDVNSRLARNQVQVADMQQSQRIAHNDMVRTARMAGRGGLRQDVAVVVTDDADPDADTINGNKPVAGSDILTIRGVISSPMYQVRQSAPPDAQTQVPYTPPSGPGLTGGRIFIDSLSPTGIEQRLDAFDRMVAESTFGGAETDALILVSATSDSIYAVVEIVDVSISSTDIDGNGVNDRRANVEFRSTLNSNMSQDLAELNPTASVFPPALMANNSVGFAGLVEEYRFYIRDETTAAGGYAPKLSRARFYPNTDRIYGQAANSNTTGVANGRIDIAENVLDLQVAFGIDVDANGLIDEDAADLTADEWLFNHEGDDPTDFSATDLLFNLALMTIVRTDRFDRGFQSDPIAALANHAYNESAVPATPQQRLDRSYRRQRLASVVDLRNVN
jgi:hypothetical protein